MANNGVTRRGVLGGVAASIAPALARGAARPSISGKIVVFIEDSTGPATKPRLYSVNPDGTQLRQLGNGFVVPGIRQVIVSPDGSLLAFSAPDGDGNPRIWTSRLDGSALRQRTFLDPAEGPPAEEASRTLDSQPRFSPDGSLIGFVRTGPYPKPIFKGNRPAVVDLRTGKTSVFPVPHDFFRVGDVTVTTDNKTLLVTGLNPGDYESLWWAGLSKIDIARGYASKVFDGAPAISSAVTGPKAKRVAISEESAYGTGPGGIYVIKSLDRQQHPKQVGDFTPAESYDSVASWSPTAKELLVIRRTALDEPPYIRFELLAISLGNRSEPRVIVPAGVFTAVITAVCMK